MSHKLYIQQQIKKQGVVMKQGYAQNVVPTNREQNLAAAMLCDDINQAIGLFRALQYANNMGTSGADYDSLEAHFDRAGYPWDNME